MPSEREACPGFAEAPKLPLCLRTSTTALSPSPIARTQPTLSLSHLRSSSSNGRHRTARRREAERGRDARRAEYVLRQPFPARRVQAARTRPNPLPLSCRVNPLLLCLGAATSIKYPNTLYGRFLGGLDRVNAASSKLEAKSVPSLLHSCKSRRADRDFLTRASKSGLAWRRVVSNA